MEKNDRLEPVVAIQALTRFATSTETLGSLPLRKVEQRFANLTSMIPKPSWHACRQVFAVIRLTRR